MSGTLFCFGMGYTARALASRLRPRGWTVRGTARTAEGPDVAAFTRETPLPDPQRSLADVTHMLVSVPPDDMRHDVDAMRHDVDDPVIAMHGDDIATAAASLRWIGYLSTTGVYGDRQGGMVDETTEPRPSGARGARRVAAEAAWRALGERTGVTVDVFRLAGIYGPGRSAFDALRAGRARRLVRKGQVFSRIHVDDIAAVLDAAMARPAAGGRVWNVCDDEPAPPGDVIEYAARLLGIAPPPEEPFETATGLSEMARSFWAENRRVSNARIKAGLGVTLLYPTYREGLAAILAAERSPSPPPGAERAG
ncbi:MAG: SDR family oxidoreductase [Alphaproteobacteria bacterium]